MRERRYVLLEPDESRLAHFGRLDAWVCRKAADIADVVPSVSRSCVWISFGPKGDDDFLRAVAGTTVPPGRLLALKPPRLESIPLLSAYFRRLLGVGRAFRFLPDEELVEVLESPEDQVRERFIGGALDLKSRALGLIRGDLTILVVPLSIFLANTVSKPQPKKLAFTDFGQTVCLGDYEASADSILYEMDPNYRARVNAQRRAQDKTFGACLRRLRRLRMLRREDFAPIAAKTIARIERNEIGKPQGKTMKVLSRKLGIRADEMPSY